MPQSTDRFPYQTVKIVSLSQPIGLVAEDGSKIETAEQFIAFAARVSNPDNQFNNMTAPKLIKYLADNKHWSPLEMVYIVCEVKTTRDIGRQILRHRSCAFQEFSQRYAKVVDQMVTREARFQDPVNRQNSIDIEEYFSRPREQVGDTCMTADMIAQEWEVRQRVVQETCSEHYAWALKNSIAKEQARVVLPEGMTMSTMYVGGTLRSWYHYCQLRRKNGTQKEHINVAQKAWAEIGQHFNTITIDSE